FWHVLSVGSFVLLDQFTKLWALKSTPVELFPFLRVFVEKNHGLALSLLSSFGADNSLILAALSILVTAIFIGLLLSKVLKDHVAFGEIFIVAGGLSNVLDRLLHKAVIDFVSIETFGFRWSTFNFADFF